MNILLVHNRYSSLGGEDTVLALEKKMLLDNGHFISEYIEDNSIIDESNLYNKVNYALRSFWSFASYDAVCRLIDDCQIDLVHIHNTFPLISPSVYWACASAGVPVVQTLHNYRFSCLNGLLLRNGAPCLDCVGKSLLKGVVKKCYRDSYSASSVVAAMQSFHRVIGTYNNKVSKYIALTEFAKSSMIAAGLPSEKIAVKPNFINDPLSFASNNPDSKTRAKSIVFVGRLAKEKGVDLLLSAFCKIKDKDWELRIIGDGPEVSWLKEMFKDPRIQWLGWLDNSNVQKEIMSSRILVLPSRWFEGFPMVLLEALANGTPVIVPNHAAFPDIVDDGVSGLLFTPNSENSLHSVLTHVVGMNNDTWGAMSASARSSYEMKYTPSVNYSQLIEIYSSCAI